MLVRIDICVRKNLWHKTICDFFVFACKRLFCAGCRSHRWFVATHKRSIIRVGMECCAEHIRLICLLSDYFPHFMALSRSRCSEIDYLSRWSIYNTWLRIFLNIWGKLIFPVTEIFPCIYSSCKICLTSCIKTTINQKLPIVSFVEWSYGLSMCKTKIHAKVIFRYSFIWEIFKSLFTCCNEFFFWINCFFERYHNET